MPGNPKTSPHYSAPQTARRRPKVGLTLSHEAIFRLDELASWSGLTKSEVVEELMKQADPNYFREHQK